MLVVKIDDEKLKKKMLVQGITFLSFFGIGIIIPLMNLGNTDATWTTIFMLSLSLMSIGLISSYPVFKILQIKRKHHAVAISLIKSKLIIRTLLWKESVEIDESQISSVSSHRMTNNKLNVIIKLKTYNHSKSPLNNQLKGHIIYINNYFLDTDGLSELAEGLKNK